MKRRHFLKVGSLWVASPSWAVNRRRGADGNQVAPPSAGLDPVVTSWSSRVVSNGGAAPSGPYQTAVSNLVAGMKSDGIWSKMYIVNPIVPGATVGVNPPSSSCWSFVTPLLVGAGTDPWKDKSGANPAATMPSNGQTNITINGFQGFNMDTGAFPSNIWASATNLGWSIYLYQFSPGNNCYSGADDYTTPHAMRLIATNAASVLDCGAQSDLNPGSFATGFISVNRSANNSLKVHFANSGVAANTQYTNTTVDNTDPRAVAFNFWFWGASNPAGGDLENRNILSFCACHQALSLADFTLFYNRVQAFRTAIGGGYV